MTFDATKPLFSLQLGGRDFLAHATPVAGGYQLDNLRVTSMAETYCNGTAAHWVQWLENTGDADTELITGLWDCDLTVPFPRDCPPQPGYLPDGSAAEVVRTLGSDCTRDEWRSVAEPLYPGQGQTHACEGGRSSQGLAPFFEVRRGNEGLLLGIGWSGQWQARFDREDSGAVRVRVGVENAAFVLHPGERIRTCSLLALWYEAGTDAGHNAFKRLMKEELCLLGRPGRPAYGPLCFGGWGGLHSEKMIDRIRQIARDRLGFECYWIDAGWYGQSDQECPDEFVGNWAVFTGDWRVNERYHPDGLEEVARTLRDNGLQFLLWLEPQRTTPNLPVPQAHPDWFLACEQNPDNLLLNLGNEEALQYAVDTVAGYVEKLGLSVYREDFNIDPLPYWDNHDEPRRRGITQIRHVMGFYRFWDTLLERFPHLIIDNCASGGRRIDVETMQRSMPMWRSDAQCCWNREAEYAQCHNAGISRWIPYSGTGLDYFPGDVYQCRSVFGASLTEQLWMYDRWEYDQSQPLDAIRRCNEEYKRARPYMSCDFYPLIPPSTDDVSWAAWQYDRPEETDGIVLAFRRPQSPFAQVTLTPRGLAPGRAYVFEDADTGETFTLAGGQSLIVDLPEPRSSKLYFYRGA